MDFNTGTINVTLQISLHYSTHSHHTLNLHRLTFNSFSTTNFPWLSPTENWTCSADCLQGNSSARTPRKTPSSIVEDACLQLRCLVIDVVFFLRIFLYGNVFINPLPSNGCTCNIAPSLRLFVPNSLQAYRHFFYSEGCACNVCVRSHLPSRCSLFYAVTTLQQLPALPP
jgi:hypothetical protein